MEMERITRELMKTIDEKDELRERALRETREIVRTSRETINAIHAGHSSVDGLKEAVKKIKELKEALKEHNDILYSGYVQTAAQELTEASLFQSYVDGEDAPKPAEIGVEATDYLLGLCDFTGELRRHMLHSLISGDMDGAEKDYNTIEEIYRAMAPADYPRGLINLKQKIDACRAIMERSLEDLTRAKQNSELKEEINRLLSGRPSS